MADKSNLNLYCQKKHISTPVYTHKQLRDGFSSTVDIEDTQYTSLFTHSTKKEAEKDAAAVASQAIINHRKAKSFDDVIKALDGVSISGSPWRQTTQQNTSVTTSSVTAPLSSGRVINHVYHPAASTATLGPPPGFEMRRPPTTGHPPQGALIRPATTGHPPQAPTTGHPSQGALIRPPTTGHPPQGALIGPPTTVYPPQRSFIRPAIPVSINGPNIDRPSLNKPSSALPLSLRSPQQPVSCGSPPLVSASPLLGAGPLLGGQVTSDKDVKDLELYCQVSNLPPPIYTISKEKGRHVGRVRVGGMKFSRLWGYDTFDDAKDSAAVVAIAGIAMIQLQLSTQQGALSKGAPLSLTAVTVPVGATNPRHSTSPHSSHPPQLPHSPQLPHNPLAAQFQQTLAQPTQDLHTPSYFLHPIPRGPTQSTTPLQVNPQVTSLPHSSNLPQLNSLLPNLPQSSSLPPTVLTPSPAMTTDYKSLLNTFCQQHHYTAPVYECSSPSDTTGYISKVTVNGHIYQSSTHGTKKAADTEAARIATETLGVASAQEVGSTPPTVGTSSSAPPSIPSYISFKNLLQEKAQKEKLSHPNYSTERTGGGFVSTVTVHVSNGPSFQLSSSAQSVKKGAEQEAARKACEKLKMI